MPPRIASVPRQWRRFEKTPIAFDFCPSCSLWRLNRSRPLTTPLRRASTLSSATAVHARPDIPPHNEQLYTALESLKLSASRYINVSRLQLALRGLETREAPVRIAVLSSGNPSEAKRLARLLLADPLAPEGTWERFLQEGLNGVEEKPLLLRYGEDHVLDRNDPIIDTAFVPSRVLQKNNLEILVSKLDLRSSPVASSPKQAILNPNLGSELHARSTYDTSHPVHKSLVLGKGIRDAVAYGRFTAATLTEELSPRMIRVAIGLPAPKDESAGVEDRYPLVDIETASDALSRFRESIANSAYFEHGWFRSGLPTLSQWLVEGAQQQGHGIKPVAKDLMSSILDDADAELTKEDSKRIAELLVLTVPEERRLSILESVQDWAERAHTELRDQLDLAFAGRNWHKIAWWKLFWRVDDVGMITSEILERRWLVDAEKGSIYVAGRIREAGLLSGTQEAELATSREQLVPETIISSPSSSEHASRTELQNKSAATEPAEMKTSSSGPPSQISLARDILLKETVPTLHTLAQKLVMLTLSTTSITSTLSALLYISMPTFSLFESGAVAAVGLVFSLRNMQRKWETAREAWQSEIHEEGRKVLKQSEDALRLIIRSGGRAKPNADGGEERAVARKAIEKARAELEKLGS